MHKMKRRDVLKIGGLSGLFAGLTNGCSGIDGAQKTRDIAQTASLGNLGVTRKKFTFAIWGDPQVAYWAAGSEFDSADYRNKWQVVNPRLMETVRLTNSLEPEFTITLGDNVHGIGEWDHWRVFLDITKEVKHPLYLLMGNHDHHRKIETRTDNPFGTLEYGNFLCAQRRLGSPEFAHYSFDAGDWHFILFSQPGVDDHDYSPTVSEYTTRPGYLEWLEEDLLKNRHRPVFFFTHHPLLPCGGSGFEFYGPDAHSRRKLMQILTRHGNVRYAFFGHVHNSVASIPEISWRYKNTAFIVVPNAANTIRDLVFPETFKSSWGTALIECDGEKVSSINFYTLAGEKVAILSSGFREYDESMFGYLTPPGEWQVGSGLVNGGFESHLKGSWFIESGPARNIASKTEARLMQETKEQGGQSLMLDYNRADSRMCMASVRQGITVPVKNTWPVLRLKYKINGTTYSGEDTAGGMITVAGWSAGDSRSSRFTIVYLLGAGLRPQLMRLRSLMNTSVVRIGCELDRWTELSLGVRKDFEAQFPGLSWCDLAVDRIVITLAGVGNSGGGKEKLGVGTVQILFDDVVWETNRISANHSNGQSGVLEG